MGCRPDGFSFHRDKELAVAFIKGYLDKQPKDHTPYEYTLPNKPVLMEVSQDLFNYISDHGCHWLSHNNPEFYKTWKVL